MSADPAWWPRLPSQPGSLWWGRPFPTVRKAAGKPVLDDQGRMSLVWAEAEPWWTYARAVALVAWAGSGDVRALVRVLCGPEDGWRAYAVSRAKARLYAARVATRRLGQNIAPDEPQTALERMQRITLSALDLARVENGILRIAHLAEQTAAQPYDGQSQAEAEARLLRTDVCLRMILESGLLDRSSIAAGAAIMPPAAIGRSTADAERIGAEAFGADP